MTIQNWTFVDPEPPTTEQRLEAATSELYGLAAEYEESGYAWISPELRDLADRLGEVE